MKPWSKPSGTIVLLVLGLTVILTYLLAATGLVREVTKLVLILVFAIGPVAIVGVLVIYQRLSSRGAGLLLKAGTVFLVIGFALFNLMLVVQQMIFLQFKEFLSAAAGSAEQEALRGVLQGVNLVQLGIDVSFDIFYCLGLILVAAVMYQHPDFGRFFAVFGIVSAAGLLIFNLWTFPDIPAESGLVDLGPLTGLWWLAVIVQMIRLARTEGAG